MREAFDGAGSRAVLCLICAPIWLASAAGIALAASYVLDVAGIVSVDLNDTLVPGAVAVGAVTLVWRAFTASITITENVVVVRNLLRTHRVPRSEINGVAVADRHYTGHPMEILALRQKTETHTRLVKMDVSIRLRDSERGALARELRTAIFS